ncbi:IS3 family transposase [Archangium violaceum]|uniref:IS3 family transposase n=1 Tax=Archangium violaceum TaxID=83451 RepID=UPI00193C71F6|nr:IS3 family transposase [Archangium violaceum]QRK05536.1 IS3 family transposase [Archangium violaceum]QRK06207.1 IS3 family transposase [Archangium violaceum]QRK10105.1 IS3 family transposase [Archangium violaceum]
MERRKRRSFTPEFRAEAVRLVREGSKSLPQVAKDLDLTESALRNWVREADGGDGKESAGALSTAEREELVRLRKEVRHLEMERDFPKKSGGLLREGDLEVKFEFIDAEKAHFPVDFMCEQLGVSRSGYYAWKERPESARDKADRALAEEVTRIHRDSRGTYGSPRVHAELRARGQRVSRKRVARLMNEHDIAARKRRRFVRTTDSRHNQPVAPNILERNFSPGQPNSTWATDITYVGTGQGWLYLAVVMDLFSRKVVGWSMSENIDRHLVLNALDMALEGRQPPQGLLHHSDRGSQYASTDYQQALAARGIQCSMSRKGNCWDNAVVESFFSSLKQELVYTTAFATHEQARLALFEYIEVFYNRQRRHSSLGYVSPVDFELAPLPQKLAS